MVKTAVDVKRIVDRFVAFLTDGGIAVERVLLAGDYAQGNATDESDVWLIVVSRSFAGVDWSERTRALAHAGLETDALVQAWGFTAEEMEKAGQIPFLAMTLNQSREVYSAPAAQRDAGGTT
jgi:hypothetical protein